MDIGTACIFWSVKMYGFTRIYRSDFIVLFLTKVFYVLSGFFSQIYTFFVLNVLKSELYFYVCHQNLVVHLIYTHTYLKSYFRYMKFRFLYLLYSYFSYIITHYFYFYYLYTLSPEIQFSFIFKYCLTRFNMWLFHGT